MELADKLGLSFAERDIQVYNVMNAEEAFLTSTPFCMMPVTRINGTPIGDGRPGPVPPLAGGLERCRGRRH